MSVGNLNTTSAWGPQFAFNGLISELRVYGEALQDADRASIEDALKAKYVP